MFSRKYIFSGNANFRKRKIFPCVWLHFKKFSGKNFLVFGKEEGKHKSRKKHKPQPRKKSRSTAREEDRDRRRGRRTGFVAGLDLGCGLCFSGFVFSFFFSKHQKIFSGKFFKMQPNTWKHFPFSEISISGKYNFPKNVLQQPNTA